MSEGCRLVVFDQKMAGPREGVTDHRPSQRIPRLPNQKHTNGKQYAGDSSSRVQCAVARIGVLGEVEQKEVVVARKLAVGHAFHPERVECYHSWMTVPRP